MEWNTLELARSSLFIEKIKNALHAAKADRLVKVCSFSKQRISGPGSVHLQAAEPLIDQDADAISVTGALLPLFLSQGHTKPNEIHRYFGQKIANKISELTSPFILRTDNKPHCRMDIHALLDPMDGLFRKKLRQKTPSQGKFP